MSSDPITVPVAPTSNTEPTRRELNLQACVYAFEGVERLPPLKTEALRSVGNAFDRNVGRVFALVFFPAIAITDAMITMACAAQVLEQMPGSSEEDQKKAIFARMAAHYDYRAATMKTGGAAETLKDVEFSAAFSFLGTTGRTVVDGAEGWLAGQITGAWTAFEAMAEDLWETALNTKPKWLAGLSGDDRLNRRQQREPRQDPRRQGDEGKKVDLEWLQRNGYDLSKCMGTVHKRRYKFDALLGIREAYAEAFSRDYDTIDAILSGGLETCPRNCAQQQALASQCYSMGSLFHNLSGRCSNAATVWCWRWTTGWLPTDRRPSPDLVPVLALG